MRKERKILRKNDDDKKSYQSTYIKEKNIEKGEREKKSI